MVADHSKAADELKSIAIQSKITLPADVSKSDAETYAKLSKLSGAEFDRAYANEMVKDYEHDVAEFQKEAMGGKDPSLKQFAAKTLPTLESHLQQAREMQRTVQASSGKQNRAISALGVARAVLRVNVWIRSERASQLQSPVGQVPA
jgi:putative membrane protein